MNKKQTLNDVILEIIQNDIKIEIQKTFVGIRVDLIKPGTLITNRLSISTIIVEEAFIDAPQVSNDILMTAFRSLMDAATP